MPTKDGWTHDRDHQSIQLGRKKYRNMEEWSRPCCICGGKFTIFTAANAPAINSSFGLRTCEEHRGVKPNPAGAYTNEELAALKRERDEAWAANTELMTANAELRRRLAQYELQPAMEAQAASHGAPEQPSLFAVPPLQTTKLWG